MKKIIFPIALALCSLAGAWAQVPGAFQYQAVVRNADGSVASNKPLEVQVNIRQGAVDGESVYEEVHTTSSNAAGIVTLRIGEGSNSSRTKLFADIDWSAATYFIDMQVDRGEGFESIGCQQLLSVPYAKCAETADNVHVTSPDGRLWRIQVDNNGTLSAWAVTE